MSLARILGYLILLFYLLAATNGVKKYWNADFIKAISKQHRLFAMLATFTALVHFVVNIINNNTSITGFLTLLLLLTTGLFGYLFSKTKDKKYYKLHRIVGPLVLFTVLLHIFL